MPARGELDSEKVRPVPPILTIVRPFRSRGWSQTMAARVQWGWGVAQQGGLAPRKVIPAGEGVEDGEEQNNQKFRLSSAPD